MFEQSFFAVILCFTIYTVGKLLKSMFEEHIRKLDEQTNSFRNMEGYLSEVVTEKRRRVDELTKRKAEAEKRRAYEKGKREALESGKVTPLHRRYAYRAFKEGDLSLNSEAPAQYDRAQNFD